MFNINKKLILSLNLLLPVALIADNKLERDDLENACGCGGGGVMNPRPRPKPKPGQKSEAHEELNLHDVKRFALHSLLSGLFNKSEEEVKKLLDNLPAELAKDLPTLQSKLDALYLKLGPELADLLGSHGALIAELVKLLSDLA